MIFRQVFHEKNRSTFTELTFLTPVRKCIPNNFSVAIQMIHRQKKKRKINDNVHLPDSQYTPKQQHHATTYINGLLFSEKTISLYKNLALSQVDSNRYHTKDYIAAYLAYQQLFFPLKRLQVLIFCRLIENAESINL